MALFAELAFSETGYEFSVGTGDYGGTNIMHVTSAISSSTWAALTNAHPFFQIGDNYAVGAYFEVAENVDT